MKCFAAVALVAAVANAAPPDVSSLPACGKVCVTNMLGQSSSLGCSSPDPSCLCTKPNFLYGLRDCANESCPDSDKPTVMSYMQSLCPASLSGATSTGNTPTMTITNALPPSGTAAVIVSTGTDSKGNAFTTTLASVDSSGSGTTPSGTGSAGGAGGIVTTLTDSKGMATLTTTINPSGTGAANSTSGASGPGGAGGAGGAGTTGTGGNGGAAGTGSTGGAAGTGSTGGAAGTGASPTGGNSGSGTSGSGSGVASDTSKAGGVPQVTAGVALGGIAGIAALALL